MQKLANNLVPHLITEDECREWRNQKTREVHFKIGGYCEESTFEVGLNSLEYSAHKYACPHATDLIIVRTFRSDGSFFDSEYVAVPRVVIAHNEGNCNCTTVCLDCIIEAGRRL